MNTFATKLFFSWSWRIPRAIPVAAGPSIKIFVTMTIVMAMTGSLAFGQSQVPVYKAVPPKFAGVYDPIKGELTGMNLSSTTTIYNNNTLTNYYSVPGLD